MPIRTWIVMGIAVLIFGKPAGATTAAPMQSAIDKAVQYLYSQEIRGSWDTPQQFTTDLVKDAYSIHSGQYGGPTALATYALLSAGEDPKGSRLASAIQFLEKADIHGIYALGVRCLVWHSIPDASSDPSIREAMGRDLSLLEKGLHAKTLMFSYLDDTYRTDSYLLGRYDHSVSQYGVLGMWALQESGMEVPPRLWTGIDEAWRKDQLSDGGWNYMQAPNAMELKGHPDWPLASASMTEAGIASLFLIQDEKLMGAAAGSCQGNIKDAVIDRGLDWMATNFDEVFTGTKSAFAPYYALYGLERIGAASGRIYFKDINWFNRGADFLMKKQAENGSWGKNVPDTAFGLLFLARGGAPVTMNKLQYDNNSGGNAEEADWNECPRDIANFNPWLAGQVEFPHVLNWQVLTLDAAPADLHSAPVLLIAGDKAVNFSDADEQKLKKFIDQGGLVLFNADCGSKAFSDSVLKLGSKLYPEEFRELKPDDVIFSHEQFRMGDHAPKMMGLSNGIRELMILSSNLDLSRAWQSRQTRMHETEFELGANILMYACDKTGILHKGDSYLVEPDSNVTAQKTVKVARIQYNGNWDPEPEGWPRLGAIMHNTMQTDLTIDTVNAGDGNLAGHDVAVLTGTQAPHIEKVGWDEIKAFVNNGGTLIVDAAGGSPNSTFASEVHDQLAAEFPNQAAGLETPLTFSDDFYAKVGTPMTEVHFRSFSRTVLGDLSTPQVRGMKFGDRIGVFFSREDLSEGLVGQQVDGVVGYQPDTAAALVEKMLVSASAK